MDVDLAPTTIHVPRSLQIIFSSPTQLTSHLIGAGYDQIDVPICTEHGIRISNVPTAVDDATADTGVFLALGAIRGYNIALINLRKNEFRGTTAPPLGHDPEGKILGILGMGGIGRNMARKLRAFGMSVQYYNRNKLSEELADGAKYVPFDELLKTSDVISLNIPLNVRPPSRSLLSSLFLFPGTANTNFSFAQPHPLTHPHQSSPTPAT